MMRRTLSIFLLLTLAIITPLRAWAWDAVGHLASAKLAYDRLDEREKAKLFVLLKSHPHYTAFLAAGRPADVDEREWVILRAAVWPDWVRPRHDDPRGPSVTSYNRSEEHYITSPFIEPKDEAAFAGKTLVPPDYTDVICALKHECNVLRLKTAAPADRAIAICWIFHLIGDIHQPLHNASYFSSEPGFEHGDLGGNKFIVKVEGRVQKLHAYWDDLMGEDSDYNDDSPQHQAELYQAAMKAVERLHGLQFSADDTSKLADHRSFASWSQESHELATTVAYQSADGSGILKHVVVDMKGPLPDDAPEVDAKYAEKAHAVADVRVALAGERLARRIHDLLPNEP